MPTPAHWQNNISTYISPSKKTIAYIVKSPANLPTLIDNIKRLLML